MSIITEFATGSYEIRRTTGSDTYVQGLLVQSALSSFWQKLSVQPLSDREALLLPEGRRERESRAVYSDIPLFPTKEGDPQRPDQIIIQGEIFEVYSVKKFAENVDLPYFRAVVQRLNTQGASS